MPVCTKHTPIFFSVEPEDAGPLMTVFKDPGSPTRVSQDFHFLPTDDLTDAQKKKQRQKEEARRAAFAREKSVEPAMRNLAIGQSTKRSCSPSTERRRAYLKSRLPSGFNRLARRYVEEEEKKQRVISNYVHHKNK